MLLQEKDEHFLPPLMQAQGTDFIPLPAKNMDTPVIVEEILPRKPPPPEQVLSRRVQGSSYKKRARRSFRDVDPRIGVEEGDIHYAADIVGEERREEGEDEEEGEVDVLRRDKGCTPVTDEVGKIYDNMYIPVYNKWASCNQAYCVKRSILKAVYMSTASDKSM